VNGSSSIMEHMEQLDEFNVQIVIDCTSSMQSTIEACSQALVTATTILSQLGRVKIGLTTYVDYCDTPHPVRKRSEPTSDVEKLQEKIRTNLKAHGGGDEPEAVKTALNDVLFNVKSKIDLVFLFTDASPHTEWGMATGRSNHYRKEIAHIESHYGSKGITDWFKLGREYERRGIPIITFLLGMSTEVANNYFPITSYLSGGMVVRVTKTTPQAISDQMIGFTKALAANEESPDLSLYAGIKLVEHPKEADLFTCQSEKDAMEKSILPKIVKGKLDRTHVRRKSQCTIEEKTPEEIVNKMQELNKYVKMERNSKREYRKTKRIEECGVKAIEAVKHLDEPSPEETETGTDDATKSQLAEDFAISTKAECLIPTLSKHKLSVPDENGEELNTTAELTPNRLSPQLSIEHSNDDSQIPGLNTQNSLTVERALSGRSNQHEDQDEGSSFMEDKEDEVEDDDAEPLEDDDDMTGEDLRPTDCLRTDQQSSNEEDEDNQAIIKTKEEENQDDRLSNEGQDPQSDDQSSDQDQYKSESPHNDDTNATTRITTTTSEPQESQDSDSPINREIIEDNLLLAVDPAERRRSIEDHRLNVSVGGCSRENGVKLEGDVSFEEQALDDSDVQDGVTSEEEGERIDLDGERSEKIGDNKVMTPLRDSASSEVLPSVEGGERGSPKAVFDDWLRKSQEDIHNLQLEEEQEEEQEEQAGDKDEDVTSSSSSSGEELKDTPVITDQGLQDPQEEQEGVTVDTKVSEGEKDIRMTSGEQADNYIDARKSDAPSELRRRKVEQPDAEVEEETPVREAETSSKGRNPLAISPALVVLGLLVVLIIFLTIRRLTSTD